MGNCLSFSCPSTISKKRKNLPIETTFKLPSPIPIFPPGGRRSTFASGSIDLGGGLKVCQVSTFNKIWATHEEGPDNLGATFFEPSPIPEGYFMLGCYSQPNNKPLFGRVLVGKAHDDPTALKEPVDYTLVWSSQSLKIKQDGFGYIWLPTPPDGYKAVGLVVTVTPDKPPLDKIRCVNSDLTEECEIDTWIWGDGDGAFNVLTLIPSHRGVLGLGMPVGTFVAQLQQQKEEEQKSGSILGPYTLPLVCLKNITTPGNLHSSMPNLPQINALIQAYSPWFYFHPDEKYLPSSVFWFFSNGALLYKKESPSDPIEIDPEGWNLPQGGTNDGAYWLDLPVDESRKEFVKKGDLQSAVAYLHVKPMFGSTYTDIAMWLFYPFNGAVKAKIEFINVALGKIGEHVGDWEHVTLRVSNFNGELMGVFFSEHSGGTWVNASDLEFHSGNKLVAYASLHGHAFYPKAGLVLQGSGGIGIRNDTAKSEFVMDTGDKFLLVAAEYLGSGPGTSIIEIPPWLSYYRRWGPKISYDLAAEIKKVEKVLPGKLKSAFTSFVKSLPDEVLGEEGPTGPKTKNNWNADES